MWTRFELWKHCIKSDKHQRRERYSFSQFKPINTEKMWYFQVEKLLQLTLLGNKGLKGNKIHSCNFHLILMDSMLSSNHRLLSQRSAFSNHPSNPCVHLTKVLAFRRIQMLLLASYFTSRVTLEGKFLLCWWILSVCQLPTLFWVWNCSAIFLHKRLKN